MPIISAAYREAEKRGPFEQATVLYRERTKDVWIRDGVQEQVAPGGLALLAGLASFIAFGGTAYGEGELPEGFATSRA